MVIISIRQDHHDIGCGLRVYYPGSPAMLVLNFSIEIDSIALSARKEHQPDELQASGTNIARELQD